MKISVENFLESLPVMAEGMFGIFVVCIIIVFAMIILSKFPDKNK